MRSRPGAAVDANCAQRGADAQKIMWAKESGRTEEMQISVTTSAAIMESADRDRQDAEKALRDAGC